MSSVDREILFTEAIGCTGASSGWKPLYRAILVFAIFDNIIGDKKSGIA